MTTANSTEKNFLQLKEAPWLITKEIEEEIREKAKQENKTVGKTFRQILENNT